MINLIEFKNNFIFKVVLSITFKFISQNIKDSWYNSFELELFDLELLGLEYFELEFLNLEFADNMKLVNVNIVIN